MAIPARASLAQLLDMPVALSAADAVSIVVQLARSPQVGRPLPVQLDPGHVWLEESGEVTLTPGLMPRLGEFAALLDQLLSPLGDAVPHGLRVVVARATEYGATATMPSLSAFAAALAPFQPADPAASVRALIAGLETPAVVPPSAATPPSPSTTPVPGGGPVWRPAPRHVGGAIAAALAAAVLGGWLGQGHTGDVPPSAPAPPPVRPSAPVQPEAHATVPPPPPAARKPIAASPARLVDRRDVQADAVFSPSFATNGTAVFFHAESGSGSALKRADAGGGDLRVASIVDDGARNYHVQLSPDGGLVAFDSDRDGVRGVYVADAQGRDVHRVSGPGYAAVPTWSPDGRRLAFIRAEADRPAVWNLWLLERDSGHQARVTSFRRGQVWGGAWFGDGRRLAYSHEDRLILHDLATGRAREIASPLPGRLVRTPAVSPDGRWIVFQVHRDGVWLFDVDRGSMQRVLDDASAEEFAWSPDGRRVAYHSRRSGGWNLWTMAVP